MALLEMQRVGARELVCHLCFIIFTPALTLAINWWLFYLNGRGSFRWDHIQALLLSFPAIILICGLWTACWRRKLGTGVVIWLLTSITFFPWAIVGGSLGLDSPGLTGFISRLSTRTSPLEFRRWAAAQYKTAAAQQKEGFTLEGDEPPFLLPKLHAFTSRFYESDEGVVIAECFWIDGYQRWTLSCLLYGDPPPSPSVVNSRLRNAVSNGARLWGNPDNPAYVSVKAYK